MHYRFQKFHGLGNDFILIDARQQAFCIQPAQIQRWSCRHTGIGCDQWLIIEEPRQSNSIASYRVFNADGSSAEQCLNGLRCIGWYFYRESKQQQIQLDSPSGTVQLAVLDINPSACSSSVKASQATTQSLAVQRRGQIRVALAPPQMGATAVQWQGAATSTGQLHVDLIDTKLQASALSMGNPHAVVFVADAQAARSAYGLALSTHSGFAAGVNAGFAQVDSPHRLLLAVCERGSGPTHACGSGACAAAVAALAQGLVQTPVQVVQPGGAVVVDWQGAQHPVYMEGPAEFVFSGEFIDDPNG